MAHLIEPATSARARCRACGGTIPKGELRFGERPPNAFGEGEMTLWFHPVCAAYTRPESFLESVSEGIAGVIENLESLSAAAQLGVVHRRLPRVKGAGRAPTGRARCRHCREMIDKDRWRIELMFFEEGRFEPSGFVHASCVHSYFGTTALLDRARHFNPELTDEDIEALESELHLPP